MVSSQRAAVEQHVGTDPEALFQKALALHRGGNLAEAADIYTVLNKWIPGHPKILLCLGETKSALGSLAEALKLFDKVIRLSPESALAHNLRGNVLCQLKRRSEAKQSYLAAIRIDPAFADAHNNLGVFLLDDGLYAEAQGCFERAIELRENFAEAHNNLGNALREQRKTGDALRCYQKAIAYKDDYVDACYNAGLSFLAENNHAGARDVFQKALQLQPGIDYLFGSYVHTKMQLCDWDDFDASLERIVSGVLSGQKTCVPFDLQLLTDCPEVQKKAAEIYAAQYLSVSSARPSDSAGAGGERIRIGYFSSDFGDHPVTHLLAGVFEAHDRKQFEVYGFSLLARSGAWRDRVSAGVDQLLEVQDKSDDEIAALARAMRLDIAVDLNGYTQDCRPGIFARRVAPVQVSYIGYLGSMGSAFVDYLVADDVLVPEEARSYYSEKIAYLPTYQANDDRPIAVQATCSHREMGLPEHGVVFCSFNHNAKIVPAIFDSWMRILEQVPDSVLWLFARNEIARENLKKEAGKRGVDASRLVFAERLPLEAHLARQRLADLFLDTFPYNAGATASAALRAGLPVLSLMGKSFQSRYGASLLTALEMSELIVTTPAAYEELAVRLGNDLRALSGVKEKLMANLPGAALFDSACFTRNLEAVFLRMHERRIKKMPPDHLLL